MKTISKNRIILLTVAALNLIPITCKAMDVSVKFLDDCTYQISIHNNGNNPAHYIDRFGSEAGIPGGVILYVEDQTGHIVSQIKGSKETGYTWLVYRSQIDPTPLRSLSSDESFVAKYSLKKLAFGLFSNTSAKREAALSYRIKLKFSVFFDLNMQASIATETKWYPFPKCLLSE